MAENDLTIRLKALDGQWETVGAERLRGIVPENFQATANEWGSDTCSFVLRRTTGAVHPDLTAFTPCRIEVDGAKVWSGRVKETPTQDGVDEQITVQGEGMQYHLDDDVYDNFYVHARMADWQDIRSFVTADLTLFTAGPAVTTGDGAIVLAFGAATAIASGKRAAVMLDVGAGREANRIVVEWESVNVTASQVLRLSSDSVAGGTSNVLTSVTLSTGGASTGTTAVTISGTGQRYLAIQLFNNAATFTPAADETVRVTAVRVFSDAAYESGNVSTLTADDVVNDAVDQATVLLSSDRSQVTAGTFVIDEHAPSGARSPREAIAAVNAYENYDTKVDVEDRICFRPRPAAPIYEIGEWSGADFSDASTNSGDDVFNRVLVEGTGADGGSLSVSRYSANIDPAPTQLWRFFFLSSRGGPFPDTVTGGAITGPFLKGKAYLVRVRAGSGVVGGAGSVTGQLHFGDLAAGDYVEHELTGNVFPLDDIIWTPSATRATATAEWTVLAETGTGTDNRVDCDVKVSTYAIPDRRGFLRSKILPINGALTTVVGERLGDLFLAAHHTTPFRGGFKVTGRRGVRRVLGGASVHPAWLLRDTGQLIRCAHRANPDTGGWTRTGRIATVSYDHDSQTSTVALDEDREGFEALLARLALVTS